MRYEYVCLDCGATTEVRATLAEKQAGLQVRCHRCEGAELRRSFTPLATVGAGPAPAAGAVGGGCCGGACCAG